MRFPTLLRRAWPHLVIVLAAVAGWLLGSPRYGFPRDDHIEAEITAEAIEMLYAEHFTRLSGYHAAADEAEKTLLRSELDAAFAADETVQKAAIESRRQRTPTEFPYFYSVVPPEAESACSMSTLEQRRAGLLRCELKSRNRAWDVLEYTRAIERTDDTWVLAVLTLDYAELRRRIR
jgi:hypothetical protein